MTDLVNSKLIMIWGSNIAETYTPEMHFILDAKEKGAKLIVVDPRLSDTAKSADWWVPIRPGTDAALALGMMNVIFTHDLHDKDFITRYTIGPILVRSDNGLLLRECDVVQGGSKNEFLVWDSDREKAIGVAGQGAKAALLGVYKPNGIECKPAFQLLCELAEQYPPEKVSKIIEIPAEDIKRLALEYARCKPSAILTSQGVARYYDGHQSVRAMITLAAISGNIGIHGGGVSFMHSFVPFMHNLLNVRDWLYPTEKRAGIISGMQVNDAITKGNPYPVKAIFSVGQNCFLNHANRNRILNEVVPQLEHITVIENFLSATAEYADIVLPAATIFEKTDLTLHLRNFYCELRQKAIEPIDECKEELEIFRLLAEKLGFGEYFDKTSEEYIDMLLSTGDPAMAGITYESLKREGAIRVNMPEPYVAFADKKFSTPTGRLEFYTEDLKKFGQELPVYFEPLQSARKPLAKKYPLVLISPHNKLTAHSSHINMPWIAEIAGEPMVEINPVDAIGRGIKDGDMVTIFNDLGIVKLKAKITEGIKPSVVSIYHGWWPKHFAQGHLNNLTHEILNPVQSYISASNWAAFDVLVEVKRVQ